MARWVRWREDEFVALFEFIDAHGYEPMPGAVVELSQELRRRGSLWTPRAREASFRSPGSVEAQIYKIRLLDMGDPRGEQQASAALRSTWRRYRAERVSPLVRLLPPMSDSGVEGDAEDRALLREWSVELSDCLAQLVENAHDILDRSTAEEIIASWAFIQKGEPFRELADELARSAIEPALAGNGLVGPPLRLKVNGFRRARQRMKEAFSWATIRPVLHWANVTLGSLTKVLPGLEPIKEFKEAWEAAGEEAYREDAAYEDDV